MRVRGMFRIPWPWKVCSLAATPRPSRPTHWSTAGARDFGPMLVQFPKSAGPRHLWVCGSRVRLPPQPPRIWLGEIPVGAEMSGSGGIIDAVTLTGGFRMYAPAASPYVGASRTMDPTMTAKMRRCMEAFLRGGIIGAADFFGKHPIAADDRQRPIGSDFLGGGMVVRRLGVIAWSHTAANHGPDCRLSPERSSIFSRGRTSGGWL